MTLELNRPHRPVRGFVAGTPLLMLSGYKPIEDLRPGDSIQTGPDDPEGNQASP
jgi:hypothetical protein